MVKFEIEFGQEINKENLTLPFGVDKTYFYGIFCERYSAAQLTVAPGSLHLIYTLKCHLSTIVKNESVRITDTLLRNTFLWSCFYNHSS